MKRWWILLLWPMSASAGGFVTADRSAGAMAVAGAATAIEGEPAYNAAADLMRAGWSLSGGTLLAGPMLSARGEGFEASTAGGPSVPPHLALRWSGERLGFGAMLTVPFGSSVSWPAEWARRFELVEAKLSVLRVSAYGGWHDERFSLSAGVFLDRGSLAIVRALDFVEVEGSAAIDTRALGFGVAVAALFRATESIDLGLSYTSRSSLSFEGWADFSAPPELRGKALDQRVRASILTPDRLALGAAWRPSEAWTLSFDLELYAWSTVDELLLDFAEEGTTDARQPRDWSVTVTPRIGASHRTWERVTLRAGAFLDPSPVPSSTLGPSSPDSLRLGVALGAAIELHARVALDLGAQLVGFTGSTSSDGVAYGGVAVLGGATLRINLPSELSPAE